MVVKLEGKTALVTGGGTGIGKSAAIALAKEGARVMVAGRRSGPLEEVAEEIKAAGGTALAFSADVTKVADIEKMREALESSWGRLDILINNAGSAMRKPFMDTTLEEFDYIYNIDLRSVFAVTQVMVPLMLKNDGGSIINISSILGLFGGKNSTAYCAMKGGVVNLTRALAVDLGPQIRVNCLCPSHIVTPMMQPEIDRLEAAGKMDKLNRVFPMKRVGYPEDMDGTILFFASDDSKWLTGNAFVIDGGMSCYV